MVKSLNIDFENFNTLTENSQIDEIVEKFKEHQSVTLIRDFMVENEFTLDKKFDFDFITSEVLRTEINDLDHTKKGTFNNIPSSILKLTSIECSDHLSSVWNEEIIGQNKFPDNLKLADVTPVYKKSNPTLAKNYRSVSVLPTVSKIFERIMQKQMSSYIDKLLSPFLCGYRKNFSTQSCIINMIEKWKMTLDNKGYAAAILMDLSKAFDTVNHELTIAKLNA